MPVGEKIKQLREAKGWTQGQLEIYSGVKRSYISVLEIGRLQKPGAAQLINLAKALGVDEDVLFEAAGMKRLSKPNEAVDDFHIWLLGKNPTAKDIKKLQRIAEELFDDNRD